jgi:hypothetical protein
MKFFSNLVNNYRSRKAVYYREKAEEAEAEAINAAVTPTAFKPSKDGNYIEIDETFTQCLIIGDPSPVNQNRQPFPSDLDPQLIDDILNIATTKETCIEIAKTVIPLPPDEENKSLEKARRSNTISAAIQEQKDKSLGMHNRLNDFVGEGIDEYHRKVYNGQTRLYKFSLLVAVQGLTKNDVNHTMNLIRSLLDSKRVLHETPTRAMIDVYQMMKPTPYILPRILSTVEVDIVAKTSLLRNPNPMLSDSGRFIGMNEKTNNPIFQNFEDGSTVSGHSLVIGKSGSGKSTDLLKDDIRAVLDGDEALHIFPKADDDTNHIRTCQAMAGQLIKVGNGGNNFNLLQVFFDPSRMDLSRDSYQKAYSDHVFALTGAIGLLIGDSFSDPQKNQLYTSLATLYENFHVVDSEGFVINLDRWQDGAFWPNLENLRDLWAGWLNDGNHKLEAMALGALYNNTAMLTRKGPLSFLVNNNSLQLDNPFIVVDISALSEVPNVQDAITLLIMNIVNVKQACAKKGEKKRRVFITLDEGANLVKNPKMKKGIEKWYREGRSHGWVLKIVGQDLAGFPREMLDMIKANTDYILLLSNLRSDNVQPLINEFNLSDDDVNRLLETGKGIGLMIIGGVHIHYRNELSDFEKNVMFGKSELNTEQKQEQEYVLKLDPVVEWIKKEHGIILKDWLSGLQDNNLPGFTMIRAQHPLEGGRKTVYIRDGLIKENGHVKNQSLDHYVTVCLLAGELSKMEAEVSTDDYGTEQEADIVAKFTIKQPEALVFKKTVAFEYEVKGTHTKEQLIEKRERLKAKKQDEKPVFDDVIFFVANDYIKEAKEALGADFVVQRGALLKEYIEKLKTHNSELFNLPLTEHDTEVA